jgi:hypothetical protein
LRFTGICLKGLINPNVVAGLVCTVSALGWQLEEDRMSSKVGGLVAANHWLFSGDIPNVLTGMLTES